MIEVSIVRFIKILRQDLSNIFHNPTLIFSNTILPLVLIGVLGFITKSGFGDTPVNSFDYYGINMMIFSVGMIAEYSCAMKSHFRKFGNQMSGSGNHLCNYASLLA